MPASRAGMARRGSEHLYRRALNALRRLLSGVFFAQDGDTQIPNLVVDLAEGSFGKLVRLFKSFLESCHILQSAIDLILRQRIEDSLDVLNLGNAMANHRDVVPCRNGQAYRVLKPIPGKERAHVEIVSHDQTIEIEFAAQQIGYDPAR